MNGFVKTAIMVTALGATTLATLPAANAGDWRWRHHHSHRGDAVAAGIVGLAAGALIGSALPPPTMCMTSRATWFAPHAVIAA